MMRVFIIEHTGVEREVDARALEYIRGGRCLSCRSCYVVAFIV